MNTLNIIIPEDAPKFTLNGLVVPARVVDVYDGDTCKCVFDFRGNFSKFTCRIYGIDTPEIRNKDLEDKARGYKARDALREVCLNKLVTLTCYNFDKYGRLLVDFSVQDISSISKWMIDSGYAKEYYGGHKQ